MDPELWANYVAAVKQARLAREEVSRAEAALTEAERASFDAGARAREALEAIIAAAEVDAGLVDQASR